MSDAGIRLDPLTPADAAALHAVLDDPELHRWTGGAPATADQWRARVDRWQTGRSPDGTQRWLNWVVRDDAGHVVGHLQATVTGRTAELAWVIGSRWQGRGYATAAARSAAALLRADGAETLCARIRPGHLASQQVALALGLHDTGEADADGEHLWADGVG